MSTYTFKLLTIGASALGALAFVYLAYLNHLLKGIPSEVRKLSGQHWETEQLRRTYDELDKQPIDYGAHLPPRLDRRYIVTGGNGLVGGFIVLQLLARGTPPVNIRIIDIRKSERDDMATGTAKDVDFIQTDITSRASVDIAFDKPWDRSCSHLPLTVFHTAAVILASDRSQHLYGFPESVNVQGTAHVLQAARKAGADVFSSTSSASISVQPVLPFGWTREPKHFWQILNEQDFFRPIRPREGYFGNYPASKAVAERLVCAANSESFRTGCIRPANGVYGNPTDNTVGGPLSKSTFPTWIPHIVQSFVHGANVAVAHLHHEAVLATGTSQGGRPFVVTDPNPPISYSDLYTAIRTLSIHPFRIIVLPPVLVLLISYVVEFYNLLPYRSRLLGRVLPEIKGEARHLQPGLFSICTHLIASDEDARKPVKDGGLGYRGAITTLEGMVLEILEWNREHAGTDGGRARKSYTTSISLADKLRELGAMSSTVTA
ncbi:hypothetical protein BJ170DRAFT_628799 [Xylariales sp. AK1849]|nr:hypothetical protein BJ170DRAFT_628799 [Xylariales sp. AK1849]